MNIESTSFRPKKDRGFQQDVRDVKSESTARSLFSLLPTTDSQAKAHSFQTTTFSQDHKPDAFVS